MMKIIIYLSWTFTCLHSHAQTLIFDTTEIHTIKQRLNSTQIVALGEVGHGFESINQAKSSFVDLLRRELNFEAIAFESSFTASVVSYIRDSTLDARTKNFLYPFWNTSSVKKSLGSFIDKETRRKPLVIGFDIQEDCRFKLFSQLLIEKQLILNNKDRLMECDSILAYYIGEHFSRKHALSHTEYVLLINNYDSILTELHRRGTDFPHYRLLGRSIENRKWLCKLLTLTSGKERMYFRDSLMAENVRWIQRELYADTKLILWAADTHISNLRVNQNPQWMGEWLSSSYKSNYFSISFQKGKGKRSSMTTNRSPAYYDRPHSKFNLVIYLDKLEKINAHEWNTPCN